MKVSELKERITNRQIHNLTLNPITNPMRNLLAKGTNFVPTPTLNIKQFTADIDDYLRRVEWKNFFWKTDEVEESKENKELLKKFYIPSTLHLEQRKIPPIIKAGLRELKVNALNKVHTLPKKTPNNLTKKEQQALQDIQTQNKHLILPSDKNLGLVLLDKTTFTEACLKHVGDRVNFKMIDNPVTETSFKEFINSLKTPTQTTPTDYHNLNTGIQTYITKYRAHKHAEFYMLPKVHKPTLSWRPIIPATGTWNACLAKIVDHYLQPIVQQTQSYLQNTTQLIKEMEELNTQRVNTLTKQTWLITADVVQLYPSIPLQEAYEITKRKLMAKQKHIAHTLTRMLHWILFNNTFTFNDKSYLQINGVATGSPVAPSVANLFMDYIENKVLIKWKTHLRLYRRYIDDIFMVFEGSEDEVEECKSDFNRMHKNITLTWETDKHTATFLDLIIEIPTNNHTPKLQHKVHQKALNNYLYLPWASSHSKNTKIGLIKGEVQRYVRNCSKFNDYIKVKKKFAYRLLARGYPPAVINNTINLVTYKQREELLENVMKKQQGKQQSQHNRTTNTQDNKQQQQIIVFKTYFVQQLQQVRWSRVLDPQKTLNKQLKCITAYKKTKNLFSVCKRMLGKHTNPTQQALT